jgi:poly(rC)-binding protein 2/3/4
MPAVQPSEALEVLQGTVDDLKEFVEQNELGPGEFHEMLEMERHLQDRKTAKKFLQRKYHVEEIDEEIDEARNEVGRLKNLVEDMGSTEEHEYYDMDKQELLKILGKDREQVKEFVESHQLSPDQLRRMKKVEKLVNDRKSVKETLNQAISKEEFHRDVVKAESDVKDLEKDLDNLEQDSGVAIDPEIEIDQERDEEDENENENGEDQEEEEDSDQEEEEEVEEEQDEEDKDGVFWEKKALLKDLEVDMTDEEIRELSLEHVKSIKEEKEHREQLIDDLEEHEMPEEELRSSSTSDLEKLKEELEEERERAEKEKVDTEKLENEAQEDIEFISGAVPQEDDDETDDEDDLTGRITEFREKLHAITTKEKEDEEESKTDAEKLKEILEEYRTLRNSEASVKIAQVLKGFLEKKLEVHRELTYAEMAERLDDIDGEEYRVLQDFFSRMQDEAYTGRISTKGVDKVIDTAEDLAEELEG